jgi:hypothetical protein
VRDGSVSGNRGVVDYDGDVYCSRTHGGTASNTFAGPGMDLLSETNADEGAHTIKAVKKSGTYMLVHAFKAHSGA